MARREGRRAGSEGGGGRDGGLTPFSVMFRTINVGEFESGEKWKV